MTVPDEGALLQQLSAQIERDVLAVHHTCTETITEPLIALFSLYRKIVHEANKTKRTKRSEGRRPRRKRSHLGRMSVALVWIRTFLLYSATLEPISLLTSNMVGFCWMHGGAFS